MRHSVCAFYRIAQTSDLGLKTMKRIYSAFLAVPCLIAGCATGIDRDVAALRAQHLFGDITKVSASLEDGGEVAPEPIAVASLEEYIRLALADNAGLHSAFEQWESALERVPQATALPDPQFTYTNFIEEIQTRTGPQKNRFQLSQRFPWFGKLKARGDVAAEHAEALWWVVEGRALALARDVKAAYFEYAYLAQALRIVEENLSLLQGLEPIVQRRIQTGAGQGELLRLQVEIGKVENEFESLRDRRPSINARLNALLNRQRDTLLPWPEMRETDVIHYTAADLKQRVLGSNPELKSLDYRVREADERTVLARFDAYPDITIGVGIIDTGEAVTSVRPPDSGDNPVSLSIGFNLPIWRHKYNAAEREARAARNSAQNIRAQRQHDLFSELELTLYKFNDAVRQITLYRDTLIPRIRQALELTQISYESGGATLLDVIDSQRELLRFEKSYWRAVSDSQQHFAALEALCGGNLS